MRYISIAFTGYRTEKLPFPPDTEHIRALSEKLKNIIEDQASAGVRYFMTGMCRGSDLIAADAVLSLREKLGIQLWCAVPFRNHRQTVPDGELALYDRILSLSDGKVTLYKQNADPSDFGRLYNERNRYMVDHCDGIIAVCPEHNILPGGTKNTVDYAKRCGKRIFYVL